MHAQSSELVEISKLNGDFKKNYGKLIGAYLYLRSISAARGRSFFWTGLISILCSAALAWLARHGLAWLIAHKFKRRICDFSQAGGGRGTGVEPSPRRQVLESDLAHRAQSRFAKGRLAVRGASFRSKRPKRSPRSLSTHLRRP
jgi:hypothetical protein